LQSQHNKPDQAWQVGTELAGTSLAGALRQLAAVSWGRARGWIETGKIRVDGQLCLDPRRALRPGERVELRVNARRPRPLLDRVSDAIVHLDDHVVVIDKPPGLSTVPYEGERDTLDLLLLRAVAQRERARGRRTQRGPRPSLGVVHRLDRETSGLMVFARTWAAKERLAEQFRVHSVQRRYLGIAHGTVRSTTVRSHLLRDRGDGLRGSLERAPGSRRATGAPAKLAVTHVELLEELPGASLIACRLETGRTHQIRIHLYELGHPLLGERAYMRDYQGELLGAPRLMLHAAELGFRHPATGALVHWEQPLPPDMQERLAALRGRAVTVEKKE
jgi:23S rRNA pseudouridine1911/1915/1917 synthase